jgi:hypothetical protein
VNPWLLSVACGLGFGIFAVAIMLPMSFPDKRTALTAAFLSRFSIGFLIPWVTLPLPAVVSGALIGLLVSLPDAVITKAFAPILGIGVLGGGVIGWIVSHAAV